ncbi:universal stress protein [Sediminispirochaeta bajacaliforniensis]|uniref:universal stress protein n=1 Tax=Sediminispirochaeta bajacaliforniensis TaxID=148 RepID=UPI00035F2167|nr:universal stress protein [Sediminispirochaeta bajacaliforniensis]
MIKHILVAVDGSPHSMSALRYGLDIARKNNASIEALFVIDRRKTQMPYMYTGGAYDISYERIYIPPDPQMREFYEKIHADIRSFGEKVISQCEKEAEDAGLECNGMIEEGFPAELIAERGRCADLIAIGQRGENAQYKRDMVGSTTEDLVRRSVRPVLVCPAEHWAIERILFPYDRSRSAENALRYYINNFHETTDQLVMMTASEGNSENDSHEQERRFLEEHGVTPKMLFTEGSPVHEVLAAAKREKSDMIMIGSHGRNKIVAYILGSTTTIVLRKSEVPVLIVY